MKREESLFFRRWGQVASVAIGENLLARTQLPSMPDGGHDHCGDYIETTI